MDLDEYNIVNYICKSTQYGENSVYCNNKIGRDLKLSVLVKTQSRGLMDL